MIRRFSETLISFLVLSHVTSAHILGENSNKSEYEVQKETSVSSKLYERCLNMDTEACLTYKLLDAATNLFQNTTIMENDNKTGNGNGRQEMGDQVDGILLQKLLEFLVPSSKWSPSDGARRNLRLKKRMLLPLLIGVVLKFGSLIPVALGKLALVGTMALIASKLSLLLIGIVGLKKLFSGSDGGLYQQGHQYHDDKYAYYGEGGQHVHQRMAYLVHGRKMGYEEDWPPSVEFESRGFATDRDEGVVNNLKRVEGTIEEENWVQSPGTESEDDVERVSEFMYTTENENVGDSQTNLRESKMFKLADQSPTTRVMNSETEVVKKGNLHNERRQLIHRGIKSETNLTQYTSNSSTVRHGDNGSVTHHEANYTRDSAHPSATIGKNDKNFVESTEGGTGEFKNQTTLEKGPRDKVIRLVKRHYTGDMDGQNHYRVYSAGRRRLDEVEGEHVDAWAIRRKIDRV